MSIKLNRAAKLSNTAQYPRTWDAIISAIPQHLVDNCTAQEIALIADAMRKQYEIGHTAGYRDAQ